MRVPNLVILFLVPVILLIGVALLALAPVSALTSEEIQQQIEQQEEKLSQTEKELASAQKNLANLEKRMGDAEGELPKLQAEIAQIEAQIAYNNLQVQILTETKKLSSLAKADNEFLRKQLINSAYVSWKQDSDIARFLPHQQQTHILKDHYFQARLIFGKDVDINRLQDKISKLTNEVEQYQEDSQRLAEKNKDLKKKKQEVLAQIAALNSARGVVAGLRNNKEDIAQTISQLNAQQKAIEEEEAKRMEEQGQDNKKEEIAPGEYYFRSYGRDLYQGHGVGLSQYGAMGAAQAGWSAEQIVEFYYTGAQVGTTNKNIQVEGHGTMTADEYVAGLGEVPNKACGTQQQVQNQPDKYALDQPDTIWDCWPEEAIKAQVIAARSYAIHYNNVYGRPICTTTTCQVYEGGEAKKWAAEETSNQVVKFGGGVIEAVYSSDNNQGFGTANNDTVWSDFSGNGTAVPYLRHVDDNAFAAEGPYTDFRRNTDGFKINKIRKMLEYRESGSSLDSMGAYSFFDSILSDINVLANIEFVRDGSNRVRKVVLVGEDGGRRNIAGWLFKSAWNSWVYDTKPADQRDYIYSLTFFLKQQ